ncbi:calpain-5-like, partial [Scleropages formosus]
MCSCRNVKFVGGCLERLTPYKGQKYSVLKKSCWEANKLFEDPEFPTVDKSLFYQRSPPGRVEWKRPGVIPNWKEQEWDPKHPESYAGIFHFCFWIFGEWIDVVIDDRLPTISGKLVYCHSKEKNEFWSALLEKAYAKLSTCYESLDGGDAVCALVDFSGGIAEHINLEKGHYASDPSAQAGLFKKLLKVYERNGMISCSIKVGCHAYSVTAVRKIRLGQSMQAHFKVEKIPMIRMRNPWGKIEWKGPWSDGSEEWQRVGSTERESIGLTVEDDGEFWMAFDDWCKYFTSADVCHVINTSLAEAGKTWNKVVHYGSWTKHPVPILNRCGGCMNDKETFLQNPQYLFNMTKEEEEILVSLQQQDMKIHRPPGQGENLTIGFVILKVELNRKYRMHDILTQEVVATSTYINSRSVFMHKILPKGCYIIVPSTFTPEVLGDFMISVYTDVDSGLRVLTEDKPRVNCWSAYLGYPRVVTQIHIHGAEGLENQDSSGGADPYVVIHCEGKSVQSAVQKDTLDPIFDMRAIFYRKKPRKPIIVEVWNSNALQDEFMGQVVLTASVQDSAERRNIRLQNRGQDAGDETPGTITLRVITSAQLTS